MLELQGKSFPDSEYMCSNRSEKKLYLQDQKSTPIKSVTKKSRGWRHRDEILKVHPSHCAHSQ